MPVMTASNKAKSGKNAKDKNKPQPKGNTATLDPTKPSESWADFFKGVGQEFGKIAWPTMPQIWANTVIVIVMVIIVTTGMWGVDNMFRGIIWVLTDVIPKQIG